MSMPAEHLYTSPKLSELLNGFADAPAIELSGIASDSRKLGAGYLFLACGGGTSHGLDFVDDALQAGVAAIAYDATTAATVPSAVGVPLIAVDRLADRLGVIANRFFDFPSQQLSVVGVTGTNGKTTVAWLIAQCLQQLGKQCSYLGTLNNEMTTPPVIELHECLADFRDGGATDAAIEVSSHALDQDRVDGVHFDTVLFTNLSRDHLDYHADMREYAEAKAKLFTDCNPEHRIINLDTEFGAQLAARCRQAITTVSTSFDRVANGWPYVFLQAAVATKDGSEITVRSSWGDGRFRLPMPGDFNVANAVMVLALLLHKGVSMQQACAALSQVEAPPGRMQRVRAGDDMPAVYVDYAHSPKAIEVALRAVRAHCRGRLWVVFGCGGDRDTGKRSLMGQVAQRLADHVVVTSDNPRSESPTAIIDDIVAGLASPQAATIIEERAAAIAWTIRHAGAADVVMIAGKGHEDYQEIDGERIPFSDYAIAAANLEVRE